MGRTFLEPELFRDFLRGCPAATDPTICRKPTQPPTLDPTLKGKLSSRFDECPADDPSPRAPCTPLIALIPTLMKRRTMEGPQMPWHGSACPLSLSLSLSL